MPLRTVAPARAMFLLRSLSVAHFMAVLADHLALRDLLENQPPRDLLLDVDAIRPWPNEPSGAALPPNGLGDFEELLDSRLELVVEAQDSGIPLRVSLA